MAESFAVEHFRRSWGPLCVITKTEGCAYGEGWNGAERQARSKNSGGATSRSRVAIKLSIRKGAINGVTKNTEEGKGWWKSWWRRQTCQSD